jgi:hypothetical protein
MGSTNDMSSTFCDDDDDDEYEPTMRSSSNNSRSTTMEFAYSSSSQDEDDDYQPPPKRRKFYKKDSSSLSSNTTLIDTSRERRYPMTELLQPLLYKMFPQYDELQYIGNPVQQVFEKVVWVYYRGKTMNYPIPNGSKHFSEFPLTTTIPRSSNRVNILQNYMQKAIDANYDLVVSIIENCCNPMEIMTPAIDGYNYSAQSAPHEYSIAAVPASDPIEYVPVETIPSYTFEFYTNEYRLMEVLSEAVLEDVCNHDKTMKTTIDLVSDIESEANILKQQKQDLEAQIAMLERISKHAKGTITVQKNKMDHVKSREDIEDHWNRLRTGQL